MNCLENLAKEKLLNWSLTVLQGIRRGYLCKAGG